LYSSLFQKSDEGLVPRAYPGQLHPQLLVLPAQPGQLHPQLLVLPAWPDRLPA